MALTDPVGYNVGPKGRGARGGRKGEGAPPPIIRKSHHLGGTPRVATYFPRLVVSKTLIAFN